MSSPDDIEDSADVASSVLTGVVTQRTVVAHSLPPEDFVLADQHISVVPDTGSYVLAVTSTNCGDDACRAHNRFAPEKSSTDIKVESNVFLLQYGQGAVTVRDTMEKVSFFGTKTSTEIESGLMAVE